MVDIRMCVLNFVLCVISSGDLYCFSYVRNLLIVCLYDVNFIGIRLKYMVSLWILMLVSFDMVGGIKLFFGMINFI